MTNKEMFQIRVDPIFRKELNDIKIKKLENGTARTILGDRRLTKAIRKMDLWREVKIRLINARIENDYRKNE